MRKAGERACPEPGNLWHRRYTQRNTLLPTPTRRPDKESTPTGTDTVGSSEAVLLGGLALKRRWQDRRKAEGKDTSKPNIVMGTETHVVRGRFGGSRRARALWRLALGR
jgi:hypothetical protein